ncbi:DUF6585 family protein [Plantactinospora soyae]|uniref:Uncharacterized protein n=1 Tax=Plantactinospora soyae TaxID=1544732 RepID=A0A927M5T7_9ACTN|nr:DUF6585 family protein [Plantactinospora soyae]MBE1488529.1 hypothetical protein [Plantactinospora soyae]
MSGSDVRAGTEQDWQTAAVDRAVRAAQGYWGEPLATYWWQEARRRSRSRLIAVPGAVALAAVLCAVPYTLMSEAYGASVVVALVGIVAAVIAVLMYRGGKPNERIGIVLFSGGFVWDDGRESDVVPFDQIADIRRSVTQHLGSGGAVKYTSHHYTVIRPDGSRLLINDAFHDVVELGDRVMSAVTALQVAGGRERLHRGETLDFAPFAINQRGLRLDSDLPVTPWSEVSEVRLRDGSLEVLVNGRKVGARFIQHVPNVFVLVTLAEELRLAGR